MHPVPHVIICGAGLTGLTTAWHLRLAGIDVTVVEATDSVGGVMQSTQRDGYLVEHGPNSCMLTTPLAALVDALELTPLLRVAAPQAQRRYIVRDGRALAVPTSPPAMLRSPLFSVSAKLRVLLEPFIGRRTTSGDESVASFVRRRLGTEPLTWAVDPCVSGVYAGDPERLSVRHAFPRLAAFEREHGSLIRGMIASARKSRLARFEPGYTSARATMVSFVDGMGALPRALADFLGHANILVRTRVIAIAHDRDRSHVTVEHDGARMTLSADAVISTLPLHVTAPRYRSTRSRRSTSATLHTRGWRDSPPCRIRRWRHSRSDSDVLTSHMLWMVSAYSCRAPSESAYSASSSRVRCSSTAHQPASRC